MPTEKISSCKDHFLHVREAENADVYLFDNGAPLTLPRNQILNDVFPRGQLPTMEQNAVYENGCRLGSLWGISPHFLLSIFTTFLKFIRYCYCVVRLQRCFCEVVFFVGYVKFRQYHVDSVCKHTDSRMTGKCKDPFSTRLLLIRRISFGCSYLLD